MKNYKGLTVEKRITAVTDKIVERELIAMQNRLGALIPVEKEAEIGDRVVLDFAREHAVITEIYV